MSLFLAAASAFLILARVLAHYARRARDAEALAAALIADQRRRELDPLHEAAEAARLYGIDHLPVPRSFLENALIEQEGRERLNEFHREDR